MKKLVTVTTVVLALLVAPAAAGVAGAADTPAPKDRVAGLGRGHRAREAGHVAADAIGISGRELLRDLRDGKSVAQVAQAHNVDPKTVVDAIVAAATKKIDAAVAAGKLDPDRAATIKDRLDDRVTALVNRELGKGAQRHHRRVLRRHARRAALGSVAAKTIGVQPRDLVQALRDGKSVADVAQAHGVDPKTVVDAIVAAATKKIDAAVAAGKLDADRAAAIKDRLDDRVTALLNRTRPQRADTAA
jgi:uncharacterized protein (DUF433 family)